MPDPVPASAAAAAVRIPGGATLTWHTRGTTCEAVLTWDDPETSDRSATEAGPPEPAVVDGAVAHLHRLVEDLATAPTPVEVVLAADHPGERIQPLPEAVADAAGLTDRRDLFQLRRPLPVPPDHPLRASSPTVHPRAFVPGTDDAAWIRANNRAFADHPDQGAETPATLAARLAEPWFDAADFLVLDDDARPGELAGSCWTKVHVATGTDPPLGEIYVIGVDPARQGEHLGPGLVLAGLDHLAARGLATAVLYVDETNAGARRLYDRLGFATHARRRVYRAPAPDRPTRS